MQLLRLSLFFSFDFSAKQNLWIASTNWVMGFPTRLFILGGIQQLRGQTFAIFLPPPPCVDSFYTLSVDKNRHFWPPPPSSCPRSYWMPPYMKGLHDFVEGLYSFFFSVFKLRELLEFLKDQFRFCIEFFTVFLLNS